MAQVKVICLRSFAGRFEGKGYNVSEGDVFMMPSGTDWIKAGLVKKVPAPRKKAVKKKAS